MEYTEYSNCNRQIVRIFEECRMLYGIFLISPEFPIKIQYFVIVMNLNISIQLSNNNNVEKRSTPFVGIFTLNFCRISKKLHLI